MNFHFDVNADYKKMQHTCLTLDQQVNVHSLHEGHLLSTSHLTLGHVMFDTLAFSCIPVSLITIKKPLSITHTMR